MAIKTKGSSGSVLPVALTPPLTTEERLHRIEAMAARISGYVQFMCQAGKQNTSAEAIERAVIAFYDQMALVESQLARIHDNFKLE